MRRELKAAEAEETHSRELLETLLMVAREAHADGFATVEDRVAHADPTAAIALAGGHLRDKIARAALRRNAHGLAVHWREWLAWLREDGFDAAGKSAEATFQTQLARGPLIRRADRDGVYMLDIHLLDELRTQALALYERLAKVPPPDQLTLIGDNRAARRELERTIARTERALEEAWRLLTEELGTEPAASVLDTDDVTRRWRARQQLLT